MAGQLHTVRIFRWLTECFNKRSLYVVLFILTYLCIRNEVLNRRNLVPRNDIPTDDDIPIDDIPTDDIPMDHLPRNDIPRNDKHRKNVRVKEVESESLDWSVKRPSLNNSRWVITQDGGGKEDVCRKVLMYFPDWIILIITSTPQKSRSYQCIYLPPSAVEEIKASLPEDNQISSANLMAYVYAIQNGAEVIYIPPARGFPVSNVGPHIFYSLNNFTALTSPAEDSFIPNEHFACNDENTGKSTRKDYKYEYCQQEYPVMQLPIVLPTEISGSLSCDPRAPPITIQQGTLVNNFHFDGALYTKRAFWALAVIDFDTPQWAIWQIIVQKLVWLTGNKIMLWNNDFNRKATNRYKKYKLNIKDQSENLSELEISCEDIFSCFQAISSHVTSANSGKSLDSMKEWLQLLKGINYNVPVQKSVDICQSEPAIFNPVDYSEQKTFSDKSKIPVHNVDNLNNLLHKTCPQHTESAETSLDLRKPWGQARKVLLVIIYNNAIYDAIPHIELMYRPFFPYILHCGPGNPKPVLLKDFPISFISFKKTPKGLHRGSLHYECTMMAIEMHYPVEGYMVMADDVLLNLNPLMKTMKRDLNTVKYRPADDLFIGDLKLAKECKDGVCDVPSGRWKWKGWKLFSAKALQALEMLEQNEHQSPLVSKCYQEIVRSTGGTSKLIASFSDVYYVPQRLADDFAYLSKYFRKAEVYMSITIPSILRCLEHVDKWDTLIGEEVLWTEPGRYTEPWKFHSLIKNKYFLHPQKWGHVGKGEEKDVEYFCDKVLPFLHDPIGTIK